MARESAWRVLELRHFDVQVHYITHAALRALSRVNRLFSMLFLSVIVRMR